MSDAKLPGAAGNKRPPPLDYTVTHTQANDALEQAGGLDAVLHSMMVGLAAFNGGHPPAAMAGIREAVARGERVYITVTIGHTAPALRCLIK
jgi:hypothetical protein